jgi:hypothetical protein
MPPRLSIKETIYFLKNANNIPANMTTTPAAIAHSTHFGGTGSIYLPMMPTIVTPP